MNNLNTKIPIIVFIFYFVSTLIIGLTIQLIILPHVFPHLHAGNGLLIKGDWNTYHWMAIDLKNIIQNEGWSKFNLFYNGQAPAGLAGFFYTLIYPKPISVLPLNCFFHSIGGLTLFFIMKNLYQNNLISFISSSAFVFFPSSILWYSQIHKDVYYNPAILMFVLSWLIFVSCFNQQRKNFFIISIFLIIFSFLLIFIFRPYFLKVLLIINLILTLIVFTKFLINFVYNKENKSHGIINLAKFILFLILTNVSIFFLEKTDFAHSEAFKGSVLEKDIKKIDISGEKVILLVDNEEEMNEIIKNDNIEKTDSLNKKNITITNDNLSFDKCINGKILKYSVIDGVETDKIVVVDCIYEVKNKWVNTKFLPSRIDYYFEQMFFYREYFFMVQSDANMTFGQNYKLNSFIDMILYIPYAIYYGYLAPFPSDWFGEGSTEATTIMKKIMSIEMILFYLLIPFTLYQIINRFSDLKFFTIFFICNILILLPTYVVPNVGVIVRHRYACFALLTAIGASYLLKKIIHR